MSDNNDLRLIEDYLPIEAISAEASREKSVRKGHISTLHLWWARRPLVACRAAVYGALVPADRWVKDIDMKNPPADPAKAEASKNGKKKGLNRRAAKEFVTKLCRYPKTDPKTEKDIKIKEETERAIIDAQRHILEAHADRLTAELAEAKETGKPPSWVEEFKFQGDKVSYDDIVAGRAPRPRVLDMFAGGGAIPLEALRLGCEAYALDLNPVAHIIQLCTLVYPQKYGKPDPDARGMTGPKNAKGETTWGGLAAEVRYWGNWVLDRVRKEIGDLYPPIPDPEVWDTPPQIAFDHETGQWNDTKPGKPKKRIKTEIQPTVTGKTARMFDDEDDEEDAESSCSAVQLPSGFLQPVAYLWTRTVRCKNPSCGATVPLVRQTWLCKKAKRYVALKMLAPKKAKQVIFEVVESETEKGLGFDPAGFSKAGNATCPFCSAVADIDFVKAEGCEGRIGNQLMAIVCSGSSQGKRYLGPQGMPPVDAKTRPSQMAERFGITVPNETLEANPRSFDVHNFGYKEWRDIFTSRQLATMTGFAGAVHSLTTNLAEVSSSEEHTKALAICLIRQRYEESGCLLIRR